MTLTREQKQLMKDDICVELAGYLMDDYHYSRDEAIDVLYTSETFERLRARCHRSLLPEFRLCV